MNLFYRCVIIRGQYVWIGRIYTKINKGGFTIPIGNRIPL